jgi:hypothetical protein
VLKAGLWRKVRKLDTEVRKEEEKVKNVLGPPFAIAYVAGCLHRLARTALLAPRAFVADDRLSIIFIASYL